MDVNTYCGIVIGWHFAFTFDTSKVNSPRGARLSWGPSWF